MEKLGREGAALSRLWFNCYCAFWVGSTPVPVSTVGGPDSLDDDNLYAEIFEDALDITIPYSRMQHEPYFTTHKDYPASDLSIASTAFLFTKPQIRSFIVTWGAYVTQN